MSSGMQPSLLQRLHRPDRGVWQDTLAPAADLVACVLGQASPLAQEMLRLADTNASSAARQRRASARQLRDVRRLLAGAVVFGKLSWDARPWDT